MANSPWLGRCLAIQATVLSMQTGCSNFLLLPKLIGYPIDTAYQLFKGSLILIPLYQPSLSLLITLYHWFLYHYPLFFSFQSIVLLHASLRQLAHPSNQIHKFHHQISSSNLSFEVESEIQINWVTLNPIDLPKGFIIWMNSSLTHARVTLSY